MREIPAPPSLATALYLHTDGGGTTQNAQLSLSFGESTPASHARATLDQIVAANPILRSGFFRTESNDFALRESEPHEVRWQHIDWTKTEPIQIPELWKAFQSDDLARPFSLENPPLLRAASIELPGGNTHYLLTFPNFLLSDKALYALLCQWLSAIDGNTPAYESFPDGVEASDPELPKRWKERLANAPRPLALEIHDPALPVGGQAEPHISLYTRERSRNIRELAEQLDVNAYSVFLGAALLLQGRLGSRKDALTLATSPNGLSLLPTRFALDPDATLGEFLRKIHRQSSDLAQESQLGLRSVLAPAGLDLGDFGAAFIWGAPVLSDLIHDALPRWINVDARVVRPTLFPLLFQVRDAGRFSVECYYDATVFSPRAIAELSDRYDQVLESIAEDPSRELKDVSLLLAHEQAHVPVEKKPSEGLAVRVEERFAETVKRQSSDLAIQGEGEASLTYSELHAHSQSLAGYLRQENMADGWVIAVCLTLTPWLPVALLGIPLAGDTCIVLDPENSPAWLAEEAGRCDAELIVCDSFTASLFEGTTRRLLIIDQQWETIESATLMEEPAVAPETAFLLPGTEKLDAPDIRKLTPRLLANAVKEATARYNLRPGARIPLTASAGTGAFLEIIFSALTSGATLLLPSAGDSLLKAASDATHLRLSFDQWRQLLLEFSASEGSQPESLRSVCIHAPGTSAILLARWQSLLTEKVATHFFWSPVDLSGLSLRATLRPDEQLQSVPIGHPTAGLSADLLDACGQPLPPTYIGNVEVALADDATFHWSLPAWRDEQGSLHLVTSEEEEIARRLPTVLDAVFAPTSVDGKPAQGLWLALECALPSVSTEMQDTLHGIWPAERKADFIFAIPGLPLSGGAIDFGKLPHPLPSAKPVPVAAAKPTATAKATAAPVPVAAAPVEPAKPAAPWEPLIPLSQEPSAPILVLIHDLEGEPLKYQTLVSLLRKEWSIYGTTARGATQPSACHRSIESEAAALIDALGELDPVGPYYLLGYRFGAILAYEIARQLRLTGRSVDYLALVGSAAPELEGAKKDWFKSITGLFTGLNKADPANASPVVESHLQALKAYRAKPIDGPVGIILGADHGPEVEQAWLDCAREGFIERMSAPSDQMLTEPAVKRLAIILGEWMVSADDESGDETPEE